MRRINRTDNENGIFRHEFKYICSEGQLALVKNRVDNLLKLDSHVETEGIYNIRSLYFDDMFNTCFYENENGTDPREKYRIRIYNCDDSFIRLELKRKVRGKTQKLSCPITKEQCLTIMTGSFLPLSAEYPHLLQRFCASQRARQLKPVVIVDYDRVPYVYKNGNVRITFDMNIKSSNAIGSFFKKNIPQRPIMPAGQQLLEVKYDDFLPDFIYTNLQLPSLHCTAFSKYYLCRCYSLQNRIFRKEEEQAENETICF